MKTEFDMQSTVYIVILNYRGWRDTISCLQSLTNLSAANYRLVVCDNGSNDESVVEILRWASGIRSSIPNYENKKLQSLVNPTAEHQPIDIQLLTRAQAESKENAAQDHFITLIDNEANLGFAGGCNVGIKYAMNRDDMSHVWLLNNDTLVEPDSLAELLKREESTSEKVLVGSKIMFMDNPDIVQALGGNRYNPWTGNSSASIDRFKHVSEKSLVAKAEEEMDYLCGASMFIPRAFIEQYGLMDERFFLYYEEIEWMRRALGDYQLKIAEDSIVYHKEGSSIGSASLDQGPSLLSEYYMFRNKLVYSKMAHPWRFPIAYLSTWLQVLNRLRRGRFVSAGQIALILLGLKDQP